jgi:hypothetical protein
MQIGVKNIKNLLVTSIIINNYDVKKKKNSKGEKIRKKKKNLPWSTKTICHFFIHRAIQIYTNKYPNFLQKKMAKKFLFSSPY